jgi:hypothetical protein
MNPWTLIWLAVIGAFLLWAIPKLRGLLGLFVVFLVAGMLAGQLMAYGQTGLGVKEPIVVSSDTSNRALGKRMAAQAGWTGSQWTALDRLVESESGWHNTAQNPHSSAYGIGQFLDSTWPAYGYRKTSDPKTQIKAMLEYISARYGTPKRAWAFKQRRNYY